MLLATLGALHNLSFYQASNTEYSERIPITSTINSFQDLAEDDKRYPVSSMAARLSDLSVALCSTVVSGPTTAKAVRKFKLTIFGVKIRCLRSVHKFVIIVFFVV